MKNRPSHGLILSLALLSIVVGCSSDERLVQHAEQSVAAQQQQSIWQARQSEIVAKQFNPEKDVRFPTEQVQQVIRVLTLNEVMGV